MGFLKRFLGGRSESDGPAGSTTPDTVDSDTAERAHELELARAEQDRLDDLTRRQLRYADYAWQPPAQGGERRADDDVEPAGPG